MPTANATPKPPGLRHAVALIEAFEEAGRRVEVRIDGVPLSEVEASGVEVEATTYGFVVQRGRSIVVVRR